MSELGRRDFLKGLFAAAVATQLPAMPEAKAEKLAENLTNTFGIRVDGMTPTSTVVEDIGGGWYRVGLYCNRGGSGGGNFVFDATEGHPKGMMVVSDPDSEMGKALIKQAWADGHKYVAREINIYPPEREKAFTQPHNLLKNSNFQGPTWNLSEGSSLVYGIDDPVGGHSAAELHGKVSVDALDIESGNVVHLYGAQVEQDAERLAVSMCVRFKDE